jgi:serine protease Do
LKGRPCQVAAGVIGDKEEEEMIQSMTASQIRRKVAVAVLLAVAAVAPTFAQETRPAPPRCNLDAEQIYRQTGSKVVEVFADAINPYRVRDRVEMGLGTGFLVQDGRVVTNYHVISNAQIITVYDGQYYWDATVLGSDPLLDIAVLELFLAAVDWGGLELAPAESVAIGQTAYAIGFPQGLGKSITQGIVVGTGRVLRDSTSSWLSPFIQTDAAVNPGNSGGPLLDDCGRVIGMVSRGGIPGQTEDIAFAIPADVLGPVIQEIVATGHVSRAWHGLYGQMVVPAVLALLGVPEDMWDDHSGFMIEPGSAAELIGLRGGDWPIELGGRPFVIGGDIITEVNGIRIDSLDTALEVVRGLKVGETVNLVYKRNLKTHQASIKLQERPVQEADLDFYRD